MDDKGLASSSQVLQTSGSIGGPEHTLKTWLVTTKYCFASEHITIHMIDSSRVSTCIVKRTRQASIEPETFDDSLRHAVALIVTCCRIIASGHQSCRANLFSGLRSRTQAMSYALTCRQDRMRDMKGQVDEV